MLYEIIECEVRKPDWKVVSVKEAVEGGKFYSGVSLNKTDKAGAVAWADFDSLTVGSTLEADFWQNPSDSTRKYLFAPKPKKAGNPAFRSQQIEKAQERKEASIHEAQDRKAEGIARAGAFRDATLIVVELMRQEPFPTQDEIKSAWREWVRFFINEGEQPFT